MVTSDFDKQALRYGGSLTVHLLVLWCREQVGLESWTAGSVDYDAADGQAAEMWDELKVFSRDGT